MVEKESVLEEVRCARKAQSHQHFDEALRHLENAYDARPDEPYLLYLLGEVFEAAGRPQNASDAYLLCGESLQKHLAAGTPMLFPVRPALLFHKAAEHAHAAGRMAQAKTFLTGTRESLEEEKAIGRDQTRRAERRKIKAGKLDYFKTLQSLHQALRPATYLEIGVQYGKSLLLAQADMIIGIDPELKIGVPTRNGARLYEMTSDDFFARHDLRTEMKHQPLDFAFIDGMHLFEFVLRDFINLERFCRRDAVIAIHDCLPIDRESCTRERVTKEWTGDVWKIVPCLSKYRPELSIQTVDTGPSGLAVVTDLDPSSKVLAENYEQICREFIPLQFGMIEARQREVLRVVPNEAGICERFRGPWKSGERPETGCQFPPAISVCG